MKPAHYLVIAALLGAAWMFRYDVTLTSGFGFMLDRWTGAMYFVGTTEVEHIPRK